MFGAYGTRSRVVHVVDFWGGPKLEANVRRLNPSATHTHTHAHTHTCKHAHTYTYMHAYAQSVHVVCVILITSKHNQKSLSLPFSVDLNGILIRLSLTVRNLGVTLDQILFSAACLPRLSILLF